MNAAPADSYARKRLLELLGIERVVARGSHAASPPMDAPRDGATVGGAAAPTAQRTSDAQRGRSRPDAVAPIAVDCTPGDAERYGAFVRHVARAIGIDASAFARRANAPHTICFGTPPPDGPATLAPPLSALRASPQAKRAFWRTLRDLKRALAGS